MTKILMFSSFMTVVLILQNSPLTHHSTLYVELGLKINQITNNLVLPGSHFTKLKINYLKIFFLIVQVLQQKLKIKEQNLKKTFLRLKKLVKLMLITCHCLKQCQ